VTYAWVAYLAAAILGEIALPFAPVATGLIDAAVLVASLTHFGWAQRTPISIGDPSIRLLPGVALIPLMRLLSLTLPVPAFPPITWLAIVAGPLLLAVLASARLARLDVGQLALARVSRDRLSVLVVVASLPTGILVGLLDPFPLGSPSDSPLAAGLVASVLVGAAAIPEELIFRGLLQQLLGNVIGAAAPVVGALAFAASYAGAQSPGILVVMAVMGLAYGLEVRRSGSLCPTMAGHSVLVLAAAFIAPPLAA
jgi:membrane protease YdiL (CAAX protease family)